MVSYRTFFYSIIIPVTRKLSKNFDFLPKIFNVRFKSLAKMKIGFIHLVQCLNPILTLRQKKSINLVKVQVFPFSYVKPGGAI